MPAGPVSPAVSRSRHPVQLLLRWAGVTLLAGFVLFCGLLLVVRHVALPQVASHRDDIARPSRASSAARSRSTPSTPVGTGGIP
jgi:hypothetical protein